MDSESAGTLLVVSLLVFLEGIGIANLFFATRGVTLTTTIVITTTITPTDFGLYGHNVETVTLVSATLYGGVVATKASGATANFIFSVNNPFSSATYITSLTMTGTGLSSSIVNWDNTIAPSSPNNRIVFAAHLNNNKLSANATTSFVYYPESNSSIAIQNGQTFDYVINFAIGQSVSGSLIAN